MALPVPAQHHTPKQRKTVRKDNEQRRTMPQQEDETKPIKPSTNKTWSISDESKGSGPSSASNARGLRTKFERALVSEQNAQRLVNQRAREICKEIPEAKGLLKCVLSGLLGHNTIDSNETHGQRSNAFTIISRAFFRVQDRFDLW